MLSPSQVFKSTNKSKVNHLKDISIDSKSSRTTQLIQQLKQDQMKENKALPIINVQADTKFERKDKAKQVLEYVQSLKSDDSGWSDMKEAEFEEYKA